MPLVRFLAFSRPRDCELGLLLHLVDVRAMKLARRLGWVARRSSPSARDSVPAGVSAPLPSRTRKPS